MKNSGSWVQKECLRKNDSLHSLCYDKELSDEDSSKSQFQKLIKRSNSHHAIVVNAIQSQGSKVCFKNLFFRRVHGLDNRIPKHIVSVDDKYLRCCLEFVHNSALKAAECHIPVSLSATTAGILLSESFITANFFDGLGRYVFECPVTTETGRLAISPDAGEQWTSGTVMGSKSMVNILNSALLQQFGALDRNHNLNRMNITDDKGLICYDLKDSSSDLSISSSYKETPLVQGHKYGSIAVHKRLASTSATNSTCFDCLSPASSTLSQGTIQCTWEQGVPRFVFSADEKEVCISKLMKVDPTDNKSLDYVYQFHMSKHDQKGHEIPNSEQLVAKMNVSTSFIVCPNNCTIMETQFTLLGNTEIYDKEMYTSSHSHKKNQRLSKKISQVFSSPSSKHRILESCRWESHALAGTNFLGTNVPPNFELAAIVVKEHLPCKKPEKVGGWGLNFLNKTGVNQSTLPSEGCQNTGDCSTSTSIVIPAGIHGGPRTRNGGPSSLIDRWRSEGHCDCGGWDEGCPLTVLQRRSSKVEFLSQVDTQVDCKTVEIVTQGPSNFHLTLRMVNVRDGLYFIHFQRPLSALQSFSIAVAIIHAQSPTLRPNTAHEL